MNPGALLVTELRAARMTIDLVDGQLVIAPKSRITEQLRNRIRYRRQEAIDHLLLERQICAMADRWHYSADELKTVLIEGQEDPARILEWIEHDIAKGEDHD